jgi:hypothetical protein
VNEKQKKSGPRRRYPDVIYRLAHELYNVANLSLVEAARAINAKDLGEQIDGTQIRYLAEIGKKDAAK